LNKPPPSSNDDDPSTANGCRSATLGRLGDRSAAIRSRPSTDDTTRQVSDLRKAHLTMLSAQQARLSAQDRWDFSNLRALFINCTLKRSPEVSHTQGLADIGIEIMRQQGVQVTSLRAIDHDIATGVWPDMTEHGWERDEWPAISEQVMASDILVISTPIWLGEKSSVCTRIIERLYGNSHLLNDHGQYAYYGRVAGCLVTGNEDGVKHCAMNVLYSLQHLGYVIPPQADAGWIGEAGPGPSYLDPGSGGPENDFTNRNTTFMIWNLLHLARLIKDAGGIPAHGNQRSEWDAGCRFDFPNPDYR
jgi:multimeric flavodoxin WrbA